MDKKKWLKPVCVALVVMVLIASAIIIISNAFHKGQDLPYEVVTYVKEDGVQTKVECGNDEVKMSLQIPEGWEYEVIQPVEGVQDEFGINFWPEDQTKGKLSFMYYTAWGVCGTGLEEIKIKLGEYKAYQGTYDNNNVWNFICLADTKGRFVVLNEGASAWWNEYGEKAMNILSTVQITEEE